MTQALVSGTVLTNKYLIKKIIYQSPESNIYLALDRKITEKEWVIKEIIPPENIAPAELKLRKNKLMETIEALKNFDSPHLAKVLEYFPEGRRDYVVMEHAKGITLEQFCQMSISGFKENEITPWVTQICEALYYLRNRPQPFIFEVLDPSHIILEQDGNIKLINFGLDRFYDKVQTDSAFSSGLEEASKEFNGFAKTLIYLLTKKEAFPEELEGLNISPKLAKIIQKCLDPQAHAVYSDFLEVKRELLEDKEPAKKEIKAKKSALASITREAQKFFHEITLRILSQKLLYFATEVAGIIIIIAALWAIAHYEKPFIKTSPIIFILSKNNELIAINSDSKEILTKITFENKYRNILSNKKGNLLFLSREAEPIIDVLDTKNFHIISSVRIDGISNKILLSPDETVLYTIQKDTNNLLTISLPDKIKEQKIKIKSIFPTGKNPINIVFSKYSSYLFISNYTSNSISVIDSKNNSLLTTIYTLAEGTNSIAASESQNIVYVSLDKWDQIHAYKITFQNNKPSPGLSRRFVDIGGEKPIDILLDKNENYLFVACAKTSTLGIIDLAAENLKVSMPIEKNPIKMFLADSNELWMLHATGEICVINPYIQKITKTLKFSSSSIDFCYSP